MSSIRNSSYQYEDHFRHLRDLYEKNELTSVINRVVEDINHRFTKVGRESQETITLKDIKIIEEPEEKGTSPEENAIIKAKFYGQYFDIVICNDVGLYFKELDLEDLRQPGLNIRTPMNMNRLSDEEMIDYYSKLIAKLGGKVTAYYLDGIAVYNHGVISSFMDNEAAQKTGVFDMIDKASSKRFEGWPLDSLSINKETGKYFVDGTVGESKDNIIKGQYEKSIVDFLLKSLHIQGNVGASGTFAFNQDDSTQMASDEDVLAASSQLMKRNKHVYKELSK